jgi:hypothetical protein
LRGSALGQKALQIKDLYNVTLEWVDSGTAGYDENHNKCFINRTMDPKEAASYFVHEMHHANEFMSGRSKAVKDYDDSQEQEYIQRMVKEEITGIYLQYEAMLEIGVAPSSQNKITELFPQYQRVRNYWIKEHLKEHPEDKEGAIKLGKQKCRALVDLWVTGGPAKSWPDLAPNKFETYEMYYRRIFRQSRAQKGAPPSSPGHSH